LIVVTIHFICHVVAITLLELCNQGEQFRTLMLLLFLGRPKKCMPNPERLVHNGLHYDIAILIFVLKLSLPSHQILLPIPIPMDAIQFLNILRILRLS
jgi:hypothetical protein